MTGCNLSQVGSKVTASANPDAQLEAVQPSSLVEDLADSKATTHSTEGIWQDALDSGMSAARLAQTATSAKEWELVALQWDQAIEVLQSIPEDSTKYGEAQVKVEQYKQNQAIAQQHQKKAALAASTNSASAKAANPAPATSSSTPSKNAQPTTAPVVKSVGLTSDFCQKVQASGQALALSNFQFYRPPVNPFDFEESFFGDDDQDYMIGCITNNGEKAISSVNMSTENIKSEGTSYSTASLDFPGQEIQPGATVPFRSPFGIDPETVEIVISQLTSYDTNFVEVDESPKTPLKIAYKPTNQPSADKTNTFCDSVKPTKSDQIFEVNKLEFYAPPRDPFKFKEADVYLVGCITNHTNEPIRGLGMTYSNDTSGGFGGAGSVMVPGNTVPPGETVPFTKFGSLDAEQDSIKVDAIGGDIGNLELGVMVYR